MLLQFKNVKSEAYFKLFLSAYEVEVIIIFFFLVDGAVFSEDSPVFRLIECNVTK